MTDKAGGEVVFHFHLGIDYPLIGVVYLRQNLGITHDLVAPSDENLEMRCICLNEIESADIALRVSHQLEYICVRSLLPLTVH